MNTELLTNAFNKGLETGNSGNDGIPASLRFKGKAEDFYWAGYKKGKAQLKARRETPEYKARQAAYAKRMNDLARAVSMITRGQHEMALEILNRDLGMGIQ